MSIIKIINEVTQKRSQSVAHPSRSTEIRRKETRTINTHNNTVALTDMQTEELEQINLTETITTSGARVGAG